MNSFYVCGGLFAAWALVVTFLGVTRDDFPATQGAARIVGAISVVLAIAAIASGVYTAATEEEGDEEHEAAALLLRV